ncbi:MAG: hypothetical protein FJ224_11945, partial [Lentisphaerae bacterium]|nr:hypothetical protein [Lentisphaerota bacterium]
MTLLGIHSRFACKAAVLTAMLALPASAVDELKPSDLTPVTWLKASPHPPVEIVREGKPLAAVYVAEGKPGEK